LDEAKQASNNTWDGGAIRTSLKTLEAHAYDCNSYTILIWGHAPPQIAQQAAHLLTWLGAAAGFQVYLFWNDNKREVEANEWLTPETVNGGFAVPGIPKIYIYRSEEYERVLLHETIHALKWDWNDLTVQPCWKLPTNSTLMPTLFEAWTELYAEWLWCCWFAPNDPTAWDRQKQWQRFQAVQILARAPTVWKETTNVFAYYVLKAALAPQFNLLLLLGKEVNSMELCTPMLDRLRAKAQTVKPIKLALRMTNPSIHA